ncbi:MAG: hypothetical protein PW844_05590 [Pantoea sp.]|nr:hypothetical protein [Pantoea sp.]MDE1185940.1 hypothetical protein [Pantoea sp.]
MVDNLIRSKQGDAIKGKPVEKVTVVVVVAWVVNHFKRVLL